MKQSADTKTPPAPLSPDRAKADSADAALSRLAAEREAENAGRKTVPHDKAWG